MHIPGDTAVRNKKTSLTIHDPRFYFKPRSRQRRGQITLKTDTSRYSKNAGGEGGNSNKEATYGGPTDGMDTATKTLVRVSSFSDLQEIVHFCMLRASLCRCRRITNEQQNCFIDKRPDLQSLGVTE